MKLSSALTILLSFARHRHGSSRSIFASANNHERKLLLNQADAAKRVEDIVKSTLASVDAGDVHGVALPLNYVVLPELGNVQALTVPLRLPGVERDQNVLVDTGSSSLSFCDESLLEEAVNITKTKYAQCNAYGKDVSCPNDPSTGGSNEFFYGQVFRGNITAYTNTGEAIASMDEVYFSIPSKEQNMPCDGPLGGIIGVAYTGLNSASEIPSPDFNVLDLWNEACQVDNLSFGTCNTANMTSTNLPSPLEQSLAKDVESGYDSAGAFGLYCDYAATIGSKTDTIVPSLGIYFGGDVALNNTFYNSGTPQVATVFFCGSEVDWYQLFLSSIRVPELNMTLSGFDQCNKCRNCYTDSGNSMLWLPLEESQCNYLLNTVKSDADTLKDWGSLLLDIEGVNGSNITLSLPLLWVAEQLGLGHVRCTGTTGNFVLGFPIFQYYYLAFNMGNNTLTFVDLQQSNETTAFIYGPELGGANKPSSGYAHHFHSMPALITFGFLLLAFHCIV